jgi:acetyl esterase/lipase
MLYRKSLVVLLSLVTLTGAAGRPQQGGALEDPPWIKEIAPPRIVYAVPGMEQVRVRKDLTYRRVAGVELKMDAYAPPHLRAGARLPAVVFIHGGRVPPNLLTKPKEWGVFVSYGQLAAVSGFVGITFNHRFYSWESWADSQSDVEAAVTYVRDNADSLGVDKDRIILWAFSAGGLFLSRALRDAPSYIRCLVSYYAILDLQPLRKEIPATITDETLSEFSPLHHLSRQSKAIAPIFIARAGLDDKVINSGADRFIQEAVSKNVTMDFSNHAAGQHGFDVLDNNERSREIIKRTIEFIKTHG